MSFVINPMNTGEMIASTSFSSQGGTLDLTLINSSTSLQVPPSGTLSTLSGFYSTGYIQIGAVQCTGNQDGIPFSSIPQTYNHLRLIIYGTQVYVPAGDYKDIQLTFNASGSGYNKVVWYQNGGAVPSFSNSSGDSYFSLGPLNGATTNVDANYIYGGLIIVDIPFYTNTTFYKNIMVTNGFYNVGSGENRLTYGFNNWASTAAVTSMFIATNVVGNFFKDGTIANLYALN